MYEQRFDFGAISLLGHDRYKRGFGHAPETPLYPGDRLHLSLSRQTGWGEWGLRWQQVWSRTYYTNTARTQTAESPSYRLLGASLTWHVHRHLEASLVADNLNNSRYLLDNGFNGGPGTEGPGRNVKLSISARY